VAVSNIAFIHTSHVLIPLFSKLASEIMPEIGVIHLTDESLIRNTIAAGRLTKATTRRLVNMIESAHDGGADAVMVTCSSIGPAVLVARMLFDFPVLRIDEPMAREAVRVGGRVGVAATLRTTLEPTIALVKQTAQQENRAIDIVPSLAEGAFEAVLAGDAERHDAILIESLNQLRSSADVIVLAQASMARVIPRLGVGGPPILSSPELAVRHARSVVAAPVEAGLAG
jgi:Asp/Glu/hydantoin racemase